MTVRRWCSVASRSCATRALRGAACRDAVAGVAGIVNERLRSRLGLGLHDERQPIEELPHARRQRRGKLVERGSHVALERRRGEAFDERPREVDRGQLRQRESGVVQTPERALLERPVLLAVVDFIEEREPGSLQRFQIAPDGPRRDAGTLGRARRSSPGATIRDREGSTIAG